MLSFVSENLDPSRVTMTLRVIPANCAACSWVIPAARRASRSPAEMHPQLVIVEARHAAQDSTARAATARPVTVHAAPTSFRFDRGSSDLARKGSACHLEFAQ